MKKALVILEVSRKQDYIFSSKHLKENVLRSSIIQYVTSPAFFSACARAHYNSDNLVYSGGGHTILQFADFPTAKSFVKTVTTEAIRRFPDLDLFAKIAEQDPNQTPGDNLLTLTKQLEQKKARREHSFRRFTFGVENERCESSDSDSVPDTLPCPPEGWNYTNSFSQIAGNTGFISVVHIDGNAMGKRVQSIYESQNADSWDGCCQALRAFSEGVQEDFINAFQEMTQVLLENKESLELRFPLLPLRPVILAGDDVCFVCRGDLGLECARIFMEKLTLKTDRTAKKTPYAACAGVAVVHAKYPFHRAYDLSEELCSSAKRFGARFDRSISAMDWHIEFGQLKDSLSEIRQDYTAMDGSHMELRPVAVHIPLNMDALPQNSREELQIRSYGFFQNMLLSMRSESKAVARSKLKELRNAIRIGQAETEFYLSDKEISHFVEYVFTAQFRTAQERMQYLQKILNRDEEGRHSAFVSLNKENRCTLYDAIEIMDHYSALKEVQP